MGRFRFILPETTKLDLSDGDYIVVKKRLNHGEREALSAAGLGDMKAPTGEQTDVKFDFEWDRYKTERLWVWLTDWSFEDQNGKRMPLTKQNIGLLDPDTVDEMQEVLSVHIEAVDREKKAIVELPELRVK